MISIALVCQGKATTVAEYFRERYHISLRFPNLPAVNVGKTSDPAWLPIELCTVAPGQRCLDINDLDTAEIICRTAKKPKDRAGRIMDQVRSAGFENDPYLEAFGMKVNLRMGQINARVLEAPGV